jgi:hypothetical protein
MFDVTRRPATPPGTVPVGHLGRTRGDVAADDGAPTWIGDATATKARR